MKENLYKNNNEVKQVIVRMEPEIKQKFKDINLMNLVYTKIINKLNKILNQKKIYLNF